MDKVCEFEGCGKPSHSKGLCSGHYQQLWKGKSLRPLLHDLTPEEYIDKWTDKKSGCWEWLGANHRGYGFTSFRNKKMKAHRFAYEVFIGPIPDGAVVHHKCSKRSCCNPDHLQLTTYHDNLAEMFARKALNARIAELETEVAELKAQLEAVSGRS